MVHPLTSSGRGRLNKPYRGREAPRGRGGRSARVPGRATFYSTRVEEVNGHDAEANEAPDSGETEDSYAEVSDASEESDLEASVSSIKPFNALLQSFTKNARGEPVPKKRRLGREEKREDAPAFAQVSDSPTRNVDDDAPEEADDLEDDSSVDDESKSEDDQEAISSYDTFETHFESQNEAELQQHVQDIKRTSRSTMIGFPSSGWKSVEVVPSGKEVSRPSKRSRVMLKQFQPKKRLQETAGRFLTTMRSTDAWIGETIFNYQDLLFTDRNSTNAPKIKKLVCLHTLNHIFKTRDKVIKNSARLTKDAGDDDVEYRDQGFTRPKVLIILPTRQACYNLVEILMELCEPEQQENKKRFQDAFHQSSDDISKEKPDDFRELFAGNDDDMFRIGIKFTRKTVKYFSQFYNSDIILASPLGLKMAIGSEDDKKRDYDFLSSIEILIIDQADALLMQNWEHVEYILENLNLQPKETHGCDFSRVRNWYLDGHAKYLRQSIVLSTFNTPEVNQIFGQRMVNVAGKSKCGRALYEGVMLDLPVQLKQTLSRYTSTNPVSDPDERFKYFSAAIIPSLVRKTRSPSNGGAGIIVFINSYMDFVRVRNFFANSHTTQNISFGSISEYTSVKEVARARSHFFTGRHSVLLYTGRAHHFRRYALRGVKSVIMYSLPDNPLFYREIVGEYLATSLADGKVDATECSVRTIFSKYDLLKLERVVGTQRLGAMLREKGGDTFDFV